MAHHTDPKSLALLDGLAKHASIGLAELQSFFRSTLGSEASKVDTTELLYFVTSTCALACVAFSNSPDREAIANRLVLRLLSPHLAQGDRNISPDQTADEFRTRYDQYGELILAVLNPDASDTSITLTTLYLFFYQSVTRSRSSVPPPLLQLSSSGVVLQFLTESIQLVKRLNRELVVQQDIDKRQRGNEKIYTDTQDVRNAPSDGNLSPAPTTARKDRGYLAFVGFLAIMIAIAALVFRPENRDNAGIQGQDPSALQISTTDQYRKGLAYHLGDGVDVDYRTAAYWYRLAAEGGNASAIYNLATMYEFGTGFDANLNNAIALYTDAAKRGHMTAQLRLGTLYETGRGVAKDAKQARYWYRLAAQSGSDEARERIDALAD